MPQLAQLGLVYQSQWFWLLLVLGAIYLFVGRGIVPTVEQTVDARDAQIAADLAAAETLRAEADRTEEAWRTRINEAHAEAMAQTAAAKAKADAAAVSRIGKADAELFATGQTAATELAAARQSALAEIEAVAADAARDIFARLTGESVTASEAQKAVAGVFSRA